MAGAIFLCGGMKLHRCHAAKPLLVSFGIIEMDVFFNSRDQFLLISEFSQIVHLRFQDSPKSFHRAIVNTMSNSGHTLHHLCGIQLCPKILVCILESTVTVEQWVCIGIVLNCFIKGVKYQFVIVAGTNFIRHNSSVIEIKNCAKVYLVNLQTVVLLKFRYVRQPLFVRFVRMKLPV